MLQHLQPILGASHPTPVGFLQIEASADAVHAIYSLDHQAKKHLCERVLLPTNRAQRLHAQSLIDATKHSLDRYFQGVLTHWELPLCMHGTDFQRSAWNALRDIPYGQVITYKEQARRMGHAKAYRAVGQANACNPVLIVVPCHRVIRTGGDVGGYAAGVDIKQQLLAHERRFG